MSRLHSVVDALLVAIWIGGGVFLVAVAAPAAFGASPDRTAAGDVVGAMLVRWHYIAIAIPLYLLVSELMRRSRTFPTLFLAIALFLASAEALTDLRIRAIRASAPVRMSFLRASHPLRREFALLHGVSSSLLLLQIFVGIAFIASANERERQTPPA